MNHCYSILQLDEIDLDLEDGELIEEEDENDKGEVLDKEKLIREGKMTPFGTMVKADFSSSQKIENNFVSSNEFKKPVSIETTPKNLAKLVFLFLLPSSRLNLTF